MKCIHPRNKYKPPVTTFANHTICMTMSNLKTKMAQSLSMFLKTCNRLEANLSLKKTITRENSYLTNSKKLAKMIHRQSNSHPITTC